MLKYNITGSELKSDTCSVEVRFVAVDIIHKMSPWYPNVAVAIKAPESRFQNQFCKTIDERKYTIIISDRHLSVYKISDVALSTLNSH